jgi:hypothetical protein
VADHLAVPKAMSCPLELLTVTVTGDGKAESIVAVRYLGSFESRDS